MRSAGLKTRHNTYVEAGLQARLRHMRLYWITWAVLLVFTVLMLWMDSVPFPRTPFIVAMIAAMLIKVSAIGGNFMHLRHERLTLVGVVVIGLLVTATVLYVLVVPDALRIHRMIASSGRTTVSSK